jgi:hypothetical protein
MSGYERLCYVMLVWLGSGVIVLVKKCQVS